MYFACSLIDRLHIKLLPKLAQTKKPPLLREAALFITKLLRYLSILVNFSYLISDLDPSGS